MSNLEYITKSTCPLILKGNLHQTFRNLRDVPYLENPRESFLLVFLMVPWNISPVEPALVLSNSNQTTCGIYKNDPISTTIFQFYLRGKMVSCAGKHETCSFPFIFNWVSNLFLGGGSAFRTPKFLHGPFQYFCIIVRQVFLVVLAVMSVGSVLGFSHSGNFHLGCPLGRFHILGFHVIQLSQSCGF